MSSSGYPYLSKNWIVSLVNPRIGIDGYDDSIPFTRAMSDDVMLAFLMNGEKLPREHGFPIRLIVPGLYGIKSVKWIAEIEVYPGDYQGYWQRKGWTDDGTIKIFSRIDSPSHYQTLRGVEQQFRGIAFGGPNSISKVELSFDAGRTWNECQIEPPMLAYSWVIWTYTWNLPQRGKFQTVVHATDTKGQLQIAEIVRPQPAGASGLHIRGVRGLEGSRSTRAMENQSGPILRRDNEQTWKDDA